MPSAPYASLSAGSSSNPRATAARAPVGRAEVFAARALLLDEALRYEPLQVAELHAGMLDEST